MAAPSNDPTIPAIWNRTLLRATNSDPPVHGNGIHYSCYLVYVLGSPDSRSRDSEATKLVVNFAALERALSIAAVLNAPAAQKAQAALLRGVACNSHASTSSALLDSPIWQ